MLRIMPRQNVYFDCFEKCAAAAVEASAVLQQMLAKSPDFTPFVGKIEAVEKAGDQATAQVVETLSKNMATPFERSDIRALIEALDDVIDGCDTVSHKLVMYRAQKVRPEATELADLLAKMTPELLDAVKSLRTSRTAEGVLVHCREVHRLEGEADKVLRRGIGALFDELKDAIELIKWKEILELLEHGTDRAEDAVKIIEDVLRVHG
jgi:predicted phosphate transport protein (TIGR00153 family)